MTKTPHFGRFILSGSGPLQITDVDATSSQAIPPLPEALTASIQAYLKAASELLKTKYKDLAGVAPSYLSDPGNVVVAVCADGVVIRYERKNDRFRIIGVSEISNVSEAAYKLSQGLVYCRDNQNDIINDNAKGVQIHLTICGSDGSIKAELATINVRFDATMQKSEQPVLPGQKPFCLLSAQNHFEFQLGGETRPEDEPGGAGTRFVVRTDIRLPVGWECIEIFPFCSADDWRPEHAPTWAEHDVLALSLLRQRREQYYSSLDPKAEARRQYWLLLEEFRSLLDSNPSHEQVLQDFLQKHPELLCPAYAKMWPKLPLGKHQTDFVFREANNDYLLVELENSNHLLFKKDGHATAALHHAYGQITDWKRYLGDNISTVRNELGLKGISTNPRSLIVLGRSKSLTDGNRQKLAAMQNEAPKVQVQTYDDVYSNAKTTVENLLGPHWETSASTKIYIL